MKLREDKEPVVKIDKLDGYKVVNPTEEEVDKAADEQDVDKEIVKKDSEADKEKGSDENKKPASDTALKTFVKNLLDDIKELISSL